MKKQMKAADRLGTAFAVIVGGHEVQNRHVRIKNLYKREEEDVPLDKLKDYRFE
jgi:histidyl-tRNA synthetase